MLRVLVCCALAVTAGGCGVAETGTAAAAGGSAEVQQAAQAKQTEERVKAQLDAAQAEAARQRAAQEEAAK